MQTTILICNDNLGLTYKIHIFSPICTTSFPTRDIFTTYTPNITSNSQQEREVQNTFQLAQKWYVTHGRSFAKRPVPSDSITSFFLIYKETRNSLVRTFVSSGDNCSGIHFCLYIVLPLKFICIPFGFNTGLKMKREAPFCSFDDYP